MATPVARLFKDAGGRALAGVGVGGTQSGSTAGHVWGCGEWGLSPRVWERGVAGSPPSVHFLSFGPGNTHVLSPSRRAPHPTPCGLPLLLDSRTWVLPPRPSGERASTTLHSPSPPGGSGLGLGLLCGLVLGDANTHSPPTPTQAFLASVGDLGERGRWGEEGRKIRFLANSVATPVQKQGFSPALPQLATQDNALPSPTSCTHPAPEGSPPGPHNVVHIHCFDSVTRGGGRARCPKLIHLHC